jgi:hypothetical protein
MLQIGGCFGPKEKTSFTLHQWLDSGHLDLHMGKTSDTSAIHTKSKLKSTAQLMPENGGIY